MRGQSIIMPGIMIAAGVAAGFLLQDALITAYMLVVVGLAVFVPLTAIIGIFALASVRLRRRVGSLLRWTLIATASIMAAFFALAATGNLIDRWKVGAVNEYVAHAVPILDQMKKKNGAYPAQLPIDRLGEPPELLRRDGRYDATPRGFRFEYVDDPAGWAGGDGSQVFDSDSRAWRDDR